MSQPHSIMLLSKFGLCVNGWFGTLDKTLGPKTVFDIYHQKLNGQEFKGQNDRELKNKFILPKYECVI